MNATFNNELKFIGLEEMDALTRDAQLSLRKIVEDSPGVIWILTANYDNKIIDALKNRCDHFKLIKPDKIDIKTHLTNIAVKESIDIDEKVIDQIIETNYPSIRGMVKKLQQLSNLGRKIEGEDVLKDADNKNQKT